MRILINGTEAEVPEGTTVADLLRARGLQGAAVAVERNQRLVPRGEHERERLTEDDRVEVVTLVGGG